MTEVIQIDGAPGAGKTYTLKQKLKAERNNGVGIRDFYWLTFTNAGREDVIPEIGDLYQDAETDPDDRARTFHSLALRLCIRAGYIDTNADPDPIIQQGQNKEVNPYVEFCNREGLRYDTEAANPRTVLAGEATTEAAGNALFAINDYLRQTCRPVSQWDSAPVEIRMGDTAVQRLLQAWNTYKRERFDHRLYEHGDYVDLAYQAGLRPAVDVLLIDEFQDLAPLEYRLYKQWRDANQLDRVYIAGDPNQSIYSFRGGTPRYFDATPVDETITLKSSRRNPERVADVGNAVLRAHSSTDPRGFTGQDPGGIVCWQDLGGKWDLLNVVVDATERYPECQPSVMLLTRTNRQLRQLERDLKDVGIPFTVLGRRKGIWRDELREMVLFLSNYASGGKSFAFDNLSTVLAALPNGEDRRDRLGQEHNGVRVSRRPVMQRHEIADAFAGLDGALGIIERLEIDAWKRDVLANVIDAPASIQPRDVSVGTVHTAKGLEAPVVFVFAETTERMAQRYMRDTELAAEEHRVYYVATTRPSQELHMVRGYFDAPLADPLRAIRAEGMAEVVA